VTGVQEPGHSAENGDFEESLAGEIAEELRELNPEIASPRRIVLTGFMGAGKSTVGPLLARKLKWRFLDVDQVIESETGSTIAELFRAQGEIWFRDYEHRTIDRLLQSEEVVLALGGGAIESEATRDALLQTEGTVLVHLEASLDTVLSRCRGTEASRPVLQDQTNLEARYQRRLPLYRTAHLTVQVDAMPPHEVVAAILNEYDPLLGPGTKPNESGQHTPETDQAQPSPAL
jgi:shikimate kinase